MRPAPLVAGDVGRWPAAWHAELAAAPRILVVGGGKAGAGMAAGLEVGLADYLGDVVGLVNVPDGETADLRRVRLHHARPVGHNFPTTAGAAGVAEMLALLQSAGPDDVAVCLISGGGSALLPAPAAGLTLADKQATTAALHHSGASIGEMNAVRKHLSAVKGGRLAGAFRGRRLLSLIVSDVVGDPLDVIASGPTAPDPTTFADALSVLDRYGLTASVPPVVIAHLRRGAAGQLPDTPKSLSPTVENRIIGSNAVALAAANLHAASLGYAVVSLGSANTGEARVFASDLAHHVRDTDRRRPVCILAGGETTVTLGPTPGMGGRNQELVLAALLELGEAGLAGMCVLSGGTDGEDGPTDAAGAVATADTWRGIDPGEAAVALARHDSYPLWDRAGGLLRTGLTGTNVMDLQVLLVT